MRGPSVDDDLGLFADDTARPRHSRQQEREAREQFHRRGRRRTVTALVGVLALLVVGVGAAYGAAQVLSIGFYDDYDGAGSGDVVIKVDSGDSVSAIASTLAEKDVVASSKAFRKAAEGNRSLSNIQPGYYQMKSRMSGAAAASRLASPEAKTGQVEIRGGMRLEDQASPNGTTTPGVLSRLAEASCTGSSQGRCATPEQVKEVARTADLASLGVPEWARGPASQADPERRLEGLIMPGVYDVKPGQKPDELVRSVVTESAAKLQAAGLPQAAEGTGHSPYEMLIIGSLVQSEALEKDFPKVSRVIENRIKQNEPIKFDSTINYLLDKPTIMTKSEDRQRPGPYNTYQNRGLPKTPISSASKQAIAAAENPAPGEWLYFVKCYPDGTSCFATNDTEHQANIKQAQERGAY